MHYPQLWLPPTLIPPGVGKPNPPAVLITSSFTTFPQYPNGLSIRKFGDPFLVFLLISSWTVVGFSTAMTQAANHIYGKRKDKNVCACTTKYWTLLFGSHLYFRATYYRGWNNVQQPDISGHNLTFRQIQVLCRHVCIISIHKCDPICENLT